MLKRIRLCFYAVFRFYNEGFRNMTWGRQLWLLILIKLFILFVVLRIFFLPTVLWRNERRAAREQRCDRIDRARAMTLRGETMKIQ